MEILTYRLQEGGFPTQWNEWAPVTAVLQYPSENLGLSQSPALTTNHVITRSARWAKRLLDIVMASEFYDHPSLWRCSADKILTTCCLFLVSICMFSLLRHMSGCIHLSLSFCWLAAVLNHPTSLPAASQSLSGLNGFETGAGVALIALLEF